VDLLSELERRGVIEDELLHRLRVEARYRALPLLDPDGQFAGLHLHRFVLGQVDVVQVWGEPYNFHAVRSQLQNAFNPSVPLAPPAAVNRDGGSLAEIAERLLSPTPEPPNWPDGAVDRSF